MAQGFTVVSESAHQIATVSLFKIKYPQYANCIMMIPNGSHLAGDKIRRARKMNIMKKEGFKNGVSDLFIAVSKNGKHGLWIEMKDHGKTYCSVSDDQRDHISDMIEQGYAAHWAAGVDEAMAIIDDYFC